MDAERFYDTIVQDEGRSNEVYPDPLGNPTIGLGHEMTKDVSENVQQQVRNDPEYDDGPAPLPEGTDEISTAIVNEIFRDDRNDSIDDGEAFMQSQSAFSSLSDERQEVVANMAFNMGRGKLNEFNQLRSHLQNDNWNGAMQEMLDSDWSGQVGNRALRLGKVMDTNNPIWFNEHYFTDHYQGELDQYLRDDDDE